MHHLNNVQKVIPRAMADESQGIRSHSLLKRKDTKI